MMRFLKTNTATRVTVGPFLDKTDGITPETALTATNEHITLMVDDGGVPTLVIDANATASGGNNDMVHVTGDDAGFYDLELTAAQLNYVGRAMLSVNYVTDHCPVFHEFMILPAVVYDSLVGGSDNLQVDTVQVNGTAQTAGDIIGDTNDIQSRLPAALVSGRMDSNVQAMANNVITASAIATDAIDSDALAANAVTEIQSGLSTLDAASVRSAIGLASANLDTQLATIDDFLDTEIAAIKAKTDNLPADPADASDIAASFSSLAATLSTIAGYIDTEIAAIKAKTDNLPASPAAAGDIPTADENAAALLKYDWELIAGEAERSVLNALRFIRNRFSTTESPGFVNVYKEDDLTLAYQKAIVSDPDADPIVEG
jgi:hypothetical protein